MPRRLANIRRCSYFSEHTGMCTQPCLTFTSECNFHWNKTCEYLKYNPFVSTGLNNFAIEQGKTLGSKMEDIPLETMEWLAERVTMKHAVIRHPLYYLRRRAAVAVHAQDDTYFTQLNICRNQDIMSKKLIVFYNQTLLPNYKKLYESKLGPNRFGPRMPYIDELDTFPVTIPQKRKKPISEKPRVSKSPRSISASPSVSKSPKPISASPSTRKRIRLPIVVDAPINDKPITPCLSCPPTAPMTLKEAEARMLSTNVYDDPDFLTGGGWDVGVFFFKHAKQALDEKLTAHYAQKA